MKIRPMNPRKAFGGGKKLTPFNRMPSVRGIRTGVRIAKKIGRNF